MKRVKRGVLLRLAGVAVLIIAACGGGDSGGASSGFAPRNKVLIKGQEINVLLPYKVPGRLLDEFTRETGVTVSVNVAGWDAVRSNMVHCAARCSDHDINPALQHPQLPADRLPAIDR